MISILLIPPSGSKKNSFGPKKNPSGAKKKNLDHLELLFGRNTSRASYISPRNIRERLAGRLKDSFFACTKCTSVCLPVS